MGLSQSPDLVVSDLPGKGQQWLTYIVGAEALMSGHIHRGELGLDFVTLERGGALLSPIVDGDHDKGISEQRKLHCFL